MIRRSKHKENAPVRETMLFELSTHKSSVLSDTTDRRVLAIQRLCLTLHVYR
jgi:hypothetical protein